MTSLVLELSVNKPIRLVIFQVKLGCLGKKNELDFQYQIEFEH